MPIASLSTNDADFIFADWGRPAILVEINQSYDAVTGATTETQTSHAVTVINTKGIINQLAICVAHLPVNGIIFLIRKSECPAEINLNSSRIHFEEKQYEIHSIEETTINGILALTTHDDNRSR